MSYDDVVLLKINRLETTSNRPEHLIAEQGCWYITLNVCFDEFSFNMKSL